jgi:hypothetical protein
MNSLGYEKHKLYKNGFERKYDEGITLGIIFNFPNKTAYGVVMYPHLIKSQKRLDKLQDAYNVLQDDLKRIATATKVTILEKN